MKYKFTIITPSYNNAHFIKDTIESVLTQSFKYFEYIIIDGGSTDGTIDILKKYDNIKWISEKDKGAADAINKGIRMANGEYIGWINSDDYYEKDALTNISNAIDESHAGLIYGNLNFVDVNRNTYKKDKTSKMDLNILLNYDADIIRQAATFFRSDIFTITGLLDTNLKLVFDYDLIIKFLKNSHAFYIDKTIANYREHSNTLTRMNISIQGKEIIRVALRHGGKFLSKLVIKNCIKKILFKKYFFD